MTSVSNYWTTKGYEPGDVKVGFEAKDVTSVLGFLRRVPNTHHVHGGRGQVFFTQLLVGDNVIGSVVHLVSGQQAFAFKLGWDPAFERGCPGYQLKAQLVCKASEQLGQFELIDSCSQLGSFIEHVWPDRRAIGSCVAPTSLPGRAALQVSLGLRWAKHQLLSTKPTGASR